MSDKLQTALNDYEAFLKAGASYGESMQALAKSLRGTPCSTILAEFAKLHAAKYKCNFTWDGQGRAVFFTGTESTRETRHDAARMSWTRNVMVWFTPAKPKTPAPEQRNRISKAHHDAAMDFLGNFEGKDLAAQIKQAVALLNAMK